MNLDVTNPTPRRSGCRTRALRASMISVLVLWGMVELVALQWARWRDRRRITPSPH